MADHTHTLTPAELARIDADIARVAAERADARVMGARYDAACEQIVALEDEATGQRRRIAELEAERDRLRADYDEATAELAQELAEERTLTGRLQALADRRWVAYRSASERARELAAVVRECEVDIQHWVTEALDAQRIMTRCGELVKDLKASAAEQAAEIGRLRALADRRWVAWQSARRRAATTKEVLATTLDQLFREDAYARSLEQQLAATTNPARAEARLAADARPAGGGR